MSLNRTYSPRVGTIASHTANTIYFPLSTLSLVSLLLFSPFLVGLLLYISSNDGYSYILYPPLPPSIRAWYIVIFVSCLSCVLIVVLQNWQARAAHE